ncbi:MAG: Mrp/NBP35 family ATP-binding protein [Clostridia bacterium]|nr:Mrp/NBP35 family ATP-binding protein [Clostridia bacterium]
MSDCNHDCGNCASSCSDRKAPQTMRASLNELSTVRKVYAVVSGKGGVGKSLVTSMLAVNAARNGARAAILDADVTGPSIPKVFGVHDKATGDGEHIFPAYTQTGIQMMSINLLLKEETDPVVWRGPILAGTVKQFWTDVIWDNVDVMFVDCPPGTGDVPLTVFQSIPVDGIIVVTSPQDLVSMIVEKAVKMAQMMNVPVFGLVENMSYYQCPHCGEKEYIYGQSHIEETAAKYGIGHVARIPIERDIAGLCDAGRIEDYRGDWLDEMGSALVRTLES